MTEIVVTEIVVTERVDPDWTALVGEGLNRLNDERAGYTDRQALAVVVKQDGHVVGGALGRSSLGLLFLDLFYLPPSLRGSGLGSDVLAQFEAEGRRRGCRSGVLYTISFQAPGFYEKCGWQRFGEVECDPPGTSRVFMTKTL